jgi:hypothetical protein
MHIKVSLLMIGLVIVAVLAILLIGFALLFLVDGIGPAFGAIVATVFGCVTLVAVTVGLVSVWLARRGTK